MMRITPIWFCPARECFMGDASCPACAGKAPEMTDAAGDTYWTEPVFDAITLRRGSYPCPHCAATITVQAATLRGTARQAALDQAGIERFGRKLYLASDLDFARDCAARECCLIRDNLPPALSVFFISLTASRPADTPAPPQRIPRASISPHHSFEELA